MDGVQHSGDEEGDVRLGELRRGVRPDKRSEKVGAWEGGFGGTLTFASSSRLKSGLILCIVNTPHSTMPSVVSSR